MTLFWPNSHGKFFSLLSTILKDFLSISTNSHTMNMKFFLPKLRTGAQLLPSITFYDILHGCRVICVGKKVIILLIF